MHYFEPPLLKYRLENFHHFWKFGVFICDTKKNEDPETQRTEMANRSVRLDYFQKTTGAGD